MISNALWGLKKKLAGINNILGKKSYFRLFSSYFRRVEKCTFRVYAQNNLFFFLINRNSEVQRLVNVSSPQQVQNSLAFHVRPYVFSPLESSKTSVFKLLPHVFVCARARVGGPVISVCAPGVLDPKISRFISMSIPWLWYLTLYRLYPDIVKNAPIYFLEPPPPLPCELITRFQQSLQASWLSVV